MGDHVALLRGINVGGRRRVPMAELREVAEGLGLDAVRTHLQSGNLLFAPDGRPPELVAGVLAEAIADQFGFEVPVVVATAEDLRITSEHPFDDRDVDEAMLHVLFLDRRPDAAAVLALDPDRSPGDRYAVEGRFAYLRFGEGSARSKLTVDWFERSLDVVATGRNLRTVRKLAELAS
ncbi:MAG: DUF1697 domain-containing protein [Actinomycetota bacterium]